MVQARRVMYCLMIIFGWTFIFSGVGIVAAQDSAEQLPDETMVQPSDQPFDQLPVQPSDQPSALPLQAPPADDPADVPSPEGIPVLVEHEGADPVGMRMALHLKETFQKSSLFRLANAEEKHISLRLVTRPQFGERPFLGSAYVVIWRYVESREVLAYYLSDRLGLVDADVVAQEAEVLVAETDKVRGRYGYLLE